jgi:formylglycine-generating enzyme required for sulfatase activity
MGYALISVAIAVIVLPLFVSLRQRRHPRYSLKLLLMASILASCGLALVGLGRDTAIALAEAEKEYGAAETRWEMARNSEKPGHMVKIAKPFYIGKFEVSQNQLKCVTGRASFYCADAAGMPADSISWDDAVGFCQKASNLCQKTIRLPSEAEWEYACRAGTSSSYYAGDQTDDLARAGWFIANAHKVRSGEVFRASGMKAPNAFGAYDMHGNLWEWVADTWHQDYVGAPTDGSEWSGGRPTRRVMRGGSVMSEARACRSSARGVRPRGCVEPEMGFRVVCEIEGQ